MALPVQVGQGVHCFQLALVLPSVAETDYADFRRCDRGRTPRSRRLERRAVPDARSSPAATCRAAASRPRR